MEEWTGLQKMSAAVEKTQDQHCWKKKFMLSPQLQFMKEQEEDDDDDEQVCTLTYKQQNSEVNDGQKLNTVQHVTCLTTLISRCMAALLTEFASNKLQTSSEMSRITV